MDRALAKSLIKPQMKSYLQTKGVKTGKPFRCLSRSHEDRNPSMSYDSKREKVRCFGCGVDWDIFDVIGDEYGLTNDKDKFDKAYEIFGININSSQNQPKIVCQFDNIDDSNQIPLNDNDPTDQVEGVRADLKPFFLQAQSNISDPNCIAYLLKRGISMETATKYGLGYVKDWQSPKALSKGKNPPATPKIIIPTSQHSYLARDIRSEEIIPENQKKCTKMKVGGADIFNIDVLTKGGEPCFVVEGEFDALSFLEIGFNAVALGSVSNRALFLAKLKTLPKCCPLILAFDADDSGKTAAKKLEEGLKDLSIKYRLCDLHQATGCKDPNEFLCKDRKAFEKRAQELLTDFSNRLSEDAQGEVEEFEIDKRGYLQTSVSNHIAAFRDSIKLSRDKSFISTGFIKLDEVFGGGLYDALYVLGAISSLGKTTFAIQVADYIASQGHNVLYFSLEMSRYEIMSKSVSRHTYLHCLDNGISASLSKDTRQITSGRNYECYTPQECDIIYCAEENYKKYTNKLFIHEGMGDLGVKEIRSAVEKHEKYTGNIPIIIIDYLQILAPYSDKATDKQNTDKAVLELKRISRDHKTPVIAISSLNRQSYKDKITMEAFKESGAIEYSSDVLIGLQLKGAGEKGFNVDIAKSKTPREVELKVLKNRNGKTGDSIDFSYYSRINLFKEMEIQTK